MDSLYCLWDNQPAILIHPQLPDRETYHLYFLTPDHWLASGWMNKKDLNKHIEDGRCIIDENIEILYG